MSQHDSQQADAYMRITQILGDKRRGIAPVIPVSPATWWRGCRTGRFPPPIKLSPGVTVWKRSAVMALVEGAA